MFDDVGENLRHAFYKLTSVLFMGKVQEVARNNASFSSVTSRTTTSQSTLSKRRKLSEYFVDISFVCFFVRRPFHFRKHFLQVFPIKSHQGALAILKLCINGDVNTGRKRTLGRHHQIVVLIRIGTARTRVTGTGTGVVDAGHSVSGEALLTRTAESTVCVLAVCIRMTVMFASFALVDIRAFVALEVVHESFILTNAISIPAVGSVRTGTRARRFRPAYESVAHVARVASANFCVRVARSICVAFVARIVVHTRFATANVARLAGALESIVEVRRTGGVFVAVVAGTGVDRFTSRPVAHVPIVALAVAAFLPVLAFSDFFKGIVAAYFVRAGVDHLLTDEAVARETSVAFAVVIGLGDNVLVGDAARVFVAVVRFARVDRVALESISIKSGLARTVVVVSVALEARPADGVFRAATVVLCTRVYRNTFVSLFFEAVHAVALVSGKLVRANRVGGADSFVRTVVNWRTGRISVTFVVFFANAVVTH